MLISCDKKLNKWSLWNLSGKELVHNCYDIYDTANIYEPNMEYGVWFDHGLCVAYKRGKCGVIDNRGNIVIPLKYRMIEIINKDTIAVQKDSLWGAVNRKGEQVLPDTSNSFLTYLKRIKYFNPVPKVATATDSLLLITFVHGKLGIANRNGQDIIKPVYEDIDEGKTIPMLACFQKYGKWGYVDYHGTEYWKNSFLKDHLPHKRRTYNPEGVKFF